MGTYGRPCKACGARLDPGERCDCEKQVVSNITHLFQWEERVGMTEDWHKRENVAMQAEHHIIYPISYI